MTIVSALGIFYCIENKQSNSYSWKKCTNSRKGLDGSRIKKLFRGWKIYIYTKTILEPIFCFIFIFYKKKSNLHHYNHPHEENERTTASKCSCNYTQWKLRDKNFFELVVESSKRSGWKQEEAVYMMANISIIYKHIWIRVCIYISATKYVHSFSFI